MGGTQELATAGPNCRVEGGLGIGAVFCQRSAYVGACVAGGPEYITFLVLEMSFAHCIQA